MCWSRCEVGNVSPELHACYIVNQDGKEVSYSTFYFTIAHFLAPLGPSEASTVSRSPHRRHIKTVPHSSSGSRGPLRLVVFPIRSFVVLTHKIATLAPKKLLVDLSLPQNIDEMAAPNGHVDFDEEIDYSDIEAKCVFCLVHR